MDANTIKKYSKKSYKQLHERAKFWFHKFIRLRDTDDYGYGNCISKGTRVKYGTEQCQAGHLFAANLFRHLEFDEDNVNVQSKQENYFNSGHEAMYTINLMEKIGAEGVKILQRKAKMSYQKPYKEDRFLMIEIIEKYKIKVKQLSKEKMFKI